MTSNNSQIVLIGTSANPVLNHLISQKLGVELSPTRLGRHPNTETKAIIDSSVRGKRVYVISTGCNPINDNLMEAMFVCDACTFGQAESVTLIMANYPYGRSDKVTQDRECIGAVYVGKMMKASGVNRLITLSLHADQIQGMLRAVDIRADNIKTHQRFAQFITTNFTDVYPTTHIVVSPDEGAIKSSRKLADHLGLSLAMIAKFRNPATNQVDNMTLIEAENSVKDKSVIIFDDIGDTMGTVIKACNLLQTRGAKSVKVFLTHGVFSGDAYEKINSCDILTHVVVSNTMPIDLSRSNKIHICDISDMIVTNIQCLENGTSLAQADLFH